MSNFLTNINLNGNQIVNRVIEKLAAAPSSPVIGREYYDTVLLANGIWNGTTWDYVKASLIPISSLAVPTAAVPFNGQKITGLGLGVALTDAASMQNILNATDAATAGLALKNPVRVLINTPITIATPPASFDSVTFVAGDRLLLSAQATGSQNGPYLYYSTGLVRVGDAAENYELNEGALWLVTEGTSGTGQQYRLSNIGTITAGTTTISPVLYTIGVPYTATGGIVLTAAAFTLQKTAGNAAYVPYVAYALIGNGSSTSIVVTHTLNSQKLTYSIVDASYNVVQCDVQFTSTTSVTFTFATAPATNAYGVTLNG